MSFFLPSGLETPKNGISIYLFGVYTIGGGRTGVPQKEQPNFFLEPVRRKLSDRPTPLTPRVPSSNRVYAETVYTDT